MTATDEENSRDEQELPARRRFRRWLTVSHIVISSFAALVTFYSTLILFVGLGDVGSGFNGHRWSRNPIYQFLDLPQTGFEFGLVIILVGPFFVVPWFVFVLYVAAIHRRCVKRRYLAVLAEDCGTFISIVAGAMITFYELVDTDIGMFQTRLYDKVPATYWILLVCVPPLVSSVIAYWRRRLSVALVLQYAVAIIAVTLFVRRLLI